MITKRDMADINLWLSTGTTMGTLLGIRPRSIQILEKLEINPFCNPLSRIGEVCQKQGISWKDFQQEIGKLEVPSMDSDWQSLPLYFLLDFLTHEHREIISDLLPSIHNSVKANEKEFIMTDTYAAFLRNWPTFVVSLNDHMKSEDTFLFPKILRFDYCDRHNTNDPVLSNGTVKVFAALHLMMHEQQSTGSVSKLLDAMAFVPFTSEWKKNSLHLLVDQLTTFQKRLFAHSRLEMEVLFPMATLLERKICDRTELECDNSNRRPIGKSLDRTIESENNEY